jgi:hypothetical protein
MQSLPGQFLRRLLARVKAWTFARRAKTSAITPQLIELATYTPALHRDVTSNGVRFYSVCGCCGARMNASATLCDGCAQKKRPARPI